MIFNIFHFSVPTLGQIQNNNYHPGYVPSSKPHLPTPRDATYSRPQASETFKVRGHSLTNTQTNAQRNTQTKAQRFKH